MEAQFNDLTTVKLLRSGHRTAVQNSAEGNLTTVFALPSESPEAHVYVVKILDVYPTLGKVSGRRLMSELGIESFARVADLTAQNKAAILSACGEV
jgi:hypothetical protein